MVARELAVLASLVGMMLLPWREKKCSWRMLLQAWGNVLRRLSIMWRPSSLTANLIKSRKEDLESRLNAEEEWTGRMELFENMDAISNIQAQLDTLKASLEETRGRAPIVGSTSGMRDVPRADLPKPKPKEFKGVKNAKEVENFLWQVERDFEGLNIEDDQVKVRTATLFLIENATLWWRRKCADMEKGLYTIKTWEDFKKELKRQFLPENVVYEARKKLRELKHRTTICEYVREFTTLMLQITNLTDEELLFYFIEGLQTWAKQELQRRSVKDVDEAIATPHRISKGESHPKPSSKSYSAKGGGDKGKGVHKGNEGKFSSRKEYEEKKKALSPLGGGQLITGGKSGLFNATAIHKKV